MLKCIPDWWVANVCDLHLMLCWRALYGLLLAEMWEIFRLVAAFAACLHRQRMTVSVPCSHPAPVSMSPVTCCRA